MLGVRTTGPAGRQASRRNPDWRREFEETLTDLSDDDIPGSGFAIADYRVSPDLGGDAAWPCWCCRESSSGRGASRRSRSGLRRPAGRASACRASASWPRPIGISNGRFNSKDSTDCLVAFAWDDGDCGRLVVVVNYAPNLSQGYVRLPFADLGGRRWRIADRLGSATSEQHGDDLRSRGLYLDVSPWQAAVFSLVCRGRS